jgi:amino acid adenylation domain-containing protein
MRFLVHHLLAEAAARGPDREALRCRGRSMTYGELEESSNGIAATLVEAGVRPGDRVGIFLPKGFEAIAAINGAMKAGAISVPLDPLAPASLAADMARDAEIAALVATAGRASDLTAHAAGGLDLRVVIAVEEAGAPVEPVPFQTIDYGQIAASGARDPSVARSEVDLCSIVYTSGSTGVPKGVMVTHRAVVAAAEWFAWQMGVTGEDRLGVHPPLHLLLSAYTLCGAAWAGASAVLITEDEARWGSELVRIIRDEGIGVWFSVTMALSQVLRTDARHGDLPSLRAIAFGGAPTAPSDVRGIVELFHGARFVHILGTSESWHNSCYPFRDAPADDGPLPVGRAPANVQTIVLTEDGRRAGPGEEGELYVRSPSMMRGYWRRPELTAAALVPHPLDPADGDLVHRTGDVLRVRPDGLLEFVGRRDLMVKTRGNRVEPEHIERTIVAHPWVQEVVVVAVPHPTWGVALVAQVVPVTGARISVRDVKAHVAERLPRYMVPSDVRIVDALPRTSAGKVDRARVRTEMSPFLRPGGLR